MSQPVIRLGTRASKLALTQSNWVKSQLESRGHAVELIEIKTEGDIKTGPLAQIGGQGLFTKRLQIALVEKEVDLAVHSMKDLPTEDHSDLMIASVPERENTSDALICRDGIADFKSLPRDAKDWNWQRAPSRSAVAFAPGFEDQRYSRQRGYSFAKAGVRRVRCNYFGLCGFKPNGIVETGFPMLLVKRNCCPLSGKERWR